MGHSNRGWRAGSYEAIHSLGARAVRRQIVMRTSPPGWGWVSAGCWASLTARSDLLLGGLEVVVDLACDVTLEDPHDLSFTLALRRCGAQRKPGCGDRCASG